MFPTNIKSYIIILLSLLFVNFFALVYFPLISNTILILLILLLSINGYSNNLIFAKPIIIIFVGLILNIISCKIYRGQDYMKTFTLMPNYFYILFYFALLFIKPSSKQLEQSLFILIIIFNILYISQFILLQKGIVIIRGVGFYRSAGIQARFRMPASGLTSLGLFLGLNKYFTESKVHYLILALSSAIVILLLGFRTMIFFSLVFSFVLLLKYYGFRAKAIRIIFVAAIAMLITANTPVFQKRIEFMMNKNKTQNFSNEDYIRVIGLNYYLHDHFKDKLEMLLGSGTAFPGTTYYKQDLQLHKRGILWVDWGLLGLSWTIGMIPVITMIWYSIKAFILKIPKPYYYLGVWFIFLVATSITTAEFYRPGNFIIQAIALALLELILREEKIKILKEHIELFFAKQ